MRAGARTNFALLGLLAIAFLTGWLAFSFAAAPSRWSLAVHAVSGLAILTLLPWKSMVARRGLRRPRPARWASLLLGLLLLISLAAGLAHSTGLLRWYADLTAIDLHVGAAIAALPFLIWHVLARPIRLRPADLSRRRLLEGGLLIGATAAGYAATELAVRLARLPGAGRRFTGSYEVASFQPDLMPVTQWMFDSIPAPDPATWRLRVAAAGATRDWTLEELARFDDRVRAILDCTGGFYSEQEWSGVFLHRLLPTDARSESLRIRSLTGYDRRFPADAAPRLLLALRIGGRPLGPGQGAPARLVAPDQRGFWWVKWVGGIEAGALPHWWQPPFPLQ